MMRLVRVLTSTRSHGLISAIYEGDLFSDLSVEGKEGRRNIFVSCAKWILAVHVDPVKRRHIFYFGYYWN